MSLFLMTTTQPNFEIANTKWVVFDIKSPKLADTDPTKILESTVSKRSSGTIISITKTAISMVGAFANTTAKIDKFESNKIWISSNNKSYIIEYEIKGDNICIFSFPNDNVFYTKRKE